MLHLLWVPNVRERAIQGDLVADVDVKSVFSVRLIHSLGVGHGVRSPLFSISWGQRAKSAPLLERSGVRGMKSMGQPQRQSLLLDRLCVQICRGTWTGGRE